MYGSLCPWIWIDEFLDWCLRLPLKSSLLNDRFCDFATIQPECFCYSYFIGVLLNSCLNWRHPTHEWLKRLGGIAQAEKLKLLVTRTTEFEDQWIILCIDISFSKDNDTKSSQVFIPKNEKQFTCWPRSLLSWIDGSASFHLTTFQWIKQGRAEKFKDTTQRKTCSPVFSPCFLLTCLFGVSWYQVMRAGGRESARQESDITCWAPCSQCSGGSVQSGGGGVVVHGGDGGGVRGGGGSNVVSFAIDWIDHLW